jgi:hypothetical protein
MQTRSFNSGLFVAIGLPLFAIFASVGIAVVAFTRGDPTLPDEYHWEGMSLDRDFADARRASDLHVHAALQVMAASETCRVTVDLSGKSPSALRLNLVHATRPDLDRQVQLLQAGSVYEGHCGVIPPGHWHVQLADAAGSWSVREDIQGDLNGTIIAAQSGQTVPDR